MTKRIYLLLLLAGMSSIGMMLAQDAAEQLAPHHTGYAYCAADSDTVSIEIEDVGGVLFEGLDLFWFLRK